MKRSESCIFLRLDKNNDRNFDAYRIPEDLVQPSLASIGINCSQEKIEKLCYDILRLGDVKNDAYHHCDSEHNLLLLKVNDVVEGLLTISETMEEEEDDDAPTSNINGRPA